MEKTARLPWQTVLLSATQSNSVTALVGVALDRPAYVDASQLRRKVKTNTGAEGIDENVEGPQDGDASGEHGDEDSKFTIPKQLSQHVALVDSPHRSSFGWILRQQMQFKTVHVSSPQPSVSPTSVASGCRVIVFFTTCAAVDFHFELLTALSKSSAPAGGGSGVAAG